MPKQPFTTSSPGGPVFNDLEKPSRTALVPKGQKGDFGDGDMNSSRVAAVALLALFVMSTTGTPLLHEDAPVHRTDGEDMPALTSMDLHQLELGNPVTVPLELHHWPSSMTVGGWPAPTLAADFDGTAMLHTPGNQPINNDGLTFVDDRFGRAERALQIDGQSLLKYRLDETSELIFGDGEAHTVSFWMNIESYTAGGTIFQLHEGVAFYYGVNNVNGRFMVMWQDNETRRPFFVNDFQQPDDVERWIHVALSTDGRDTHLFLDGQHAGSYLYAHRNVNNASAPGEEMHFGRQYPSSTGQGTFAIDDLQVVDMALTNATAPAVYAAQSVAWTATPPLPDGLRLDGMRAIIDGVPTAGGFSSHELLGEWTHNGTATAVNATLNFSIAPASEPQQASLMFDDQHRIDESEPQSPFYGYRTTVGAPVNLPFSMASWRAGPDYHHRMDQTVAIPFEAGLEPSMSDLRLVNQSNITMVDDRHGRSESAVRIEAGGELGYNVTDWNEVAFRDNQDIAISFWMRMDSDGDANNIVRHHGDDVTAWSLAWDPTAVAGGSQGAIQYEHINWKSGGGGTSGRSWIPSPSMTDWHHVVWAKNEGYMRHYIDGGRQGMVHTQEEYVYWNQSTMLTFGGGEGAVEIDDFRIWNLSIPESRIVDITRLRTAATYSVTPELPAGLTIDQRNMTIQGTASSPLNASTYTLVATWNESLWGPTTSQQFTFEVSGEPDADLDGVPDEEDAFPADPTEQTDQDGDGVGDNADAFPEDGSEQADTDGDGVGDNNDADPFDANENRTRDDVVVDEENTVFDPLSDPLRLSLAGCGLLLLMGLLVTLLLKRSRDSEVEPSVGDGSKTVFQLPEDGTEIGEYSKNVPELIDSDQ